MPHSTRILLARHGQSVCNAAKQWHLGILQGRYRDARDPLAQQLWRAQRQDRARYCPPGGESLSDMAQRVLPCLHTILAQAAHRTVLIVAHRYTNRLVLGA